MVHAHKDCNCNTDLLDCWIIHPAGRRKFQDEGEISNVQENVFQMFAGAAVK